MPESLDVEQFIGRHCDLCGCRQTDNELKRSLKCWRLTNLNKGSRIGEHLCEELEWKGKEGRKEEKKAARKVGR